MTPARLRAVQADITTLPVDAIVNAANSSLLGGGGVDGAIHRAAGRSSSRSAAFSAAARPVTQAHQGLSAAGEVRHPHRRPGVARRGERRAELLASCYRRSIQVAAATGIQTLAFPSISTGVFGYPSSPRRGSR